MNIINIIGISAGLCTTIAFVPQVVKVAKTKKTDGISLWMYIIFIIGIFLWLIYGILIKSYEIILANTITFPLAIYVLVYVIKNDINDKS